jgi:hypothetical protein
MKKEARNLFFKGTNITDFSLTPVSRNFKKKETRIRWVCSMSLPSRLEESSPRIALLTPLSKNSSKLIGMSANTKVTIFDI